MNIPTGREGEKLLSLLCTQAGVTCNSALEDDNGWDLYLEFPGDQLPRTPIDLQPAAHRALVQVKTTRGAKKTCRIKLSNALRFAKSPLPCFIALVQLRAEAPSRIYIIHVWTDLIAAFLREARKADAQQNHAIHKVYIPIKFSPTDDRTNDPIGWIRDQIASHDKKYSATKRKFEESVGFERGHGTAKVTFKLDTPDDIIDWQLGVKEWLNVSRFTFTSERFGISAGKPDIAVEEAGKLYLTPTGHPATLRLSLPSGEHRHIPAELFVSAVPPFLMDRQRWRIRAGCLDLTPIDGGIAGKAKIDFNTSLPLEQIRDFTALYSIADGQSIRAHLLLDEKRIDCGHLQLKALPDRRWALTLPRFFNPV